jgi:hypothetical protein
LSFINEAKSLIDEVINLINKGKKVVDERLRVVCKFLKDKINSAKIN